jgi:hypothetical protein
VPSTLIQACLGSKNVQYSDATIPNMDTLDLLEPFVNGRRACLHEANLLLLVDGPMLLLVDGPITTSVVASAFQIIFRVKIHANDVFLFFKNYF